MKRVSYTQKEKVNALVNRYRELYSKDPRSRIFAPLADAYRKQGRVDEALKICLEGIKIHPEYSSGRLILGKCYFDKHMFNNAVFELESVTRVNPENALAQTYLGKAYLGMREYEKALLAFNEARKSVPSNEKLDKIITNLTNKIKVVFGSVERETGQQGIDYFSKRPLFSIESDQFVVRSLKKVFSSQTKKADSLSPRDSTKETSESLKKLFLSRGLTHKVKKLSTADRFENIILEKKYIPPDQSPVRRSNIIKKKELGVRAESILNVVKNDVDLPALIGRKNLHDDDFFIDTYSSESSSEVVRDMIENDEKNFRNFDGAAPERLIKTSFEKKKKDFAHVESVEKLNLFLSRIRERAY